MSDKPVVRFAPSPTGQVHIGNIRVALFNWLFARHCNGKFLLRMEDTDFKRSTPESTQTILDSLKWLGLDYDGDVFYQSSHREDHLDAVEKLVSQGDAYRDCIEGVVKFRIPREAKDIPEIQEIGGKKYVVYQDLVKGEMKKPLDDMQDFVLVRSDESPVFHIANVVDDITQGVTHVIRGDDHVENTFKHILLFRCLGAEVPQYAHLPMIVNDAGKPYSKRDGDAFVGDFIERGFLPDAMVNYLALLGWNPGDGREKMSRHELVSAFTLERCHRSPAKMDIRKLLSLNHKYISEMDIDDFASLSSIYMERCEELGFKWGADKNEESSFLVCGLMQSRLKKFEDVREWGYFFGIPDYKGLLESSEEFAKNYKSLSKSISLYKFLDDLESAFGSCDFDVPSLETAVVNLTEGTYHLKKGSLNQAIRLVVTAVDRGAGICETLSVIGKESVLGRIKAFREFSKQAIMPL